MLLISVRHKKKLAPNLPPLKSAALGSSLLLYAMQMKEVEKMYNSKIKVKLR